MQYVLKLPRGKETIISLEDKEQVEKYRWELRKGYVQAKTKILSAMPLHKFIWTYVHGQVIPEGHTIDHIDNNPLNNTFQNLRVLTSRQQAANKITIGKYGFRGVSPSKGKWRARFSHIYIGMRDTREEAGYLWDTYMYQQEDLRGIVKLNMPHNIEKYAEEPLIVLEPKKLTKLSTPKIKTKCIKSENGISTCVSGTGDLFTIDTEDYDKIKYYTVNLSKKGNTILLEGKKVSLQKYLMDILDEKELRVGHREGGVRDFTKANLFVGTVSEVAQAKRKRDNCASEFHGVGIDRERDGWKFVIDADGIKHKKRFKYEEEYEAARYHDLFIITNMPESYRRLNFTDWKNPEVLEEWKKHFEI